MIKPDLSDEKLVLAFRGRDRSAFEALLKRYLKPIYSFVYRYIGGGREAEDLTQEIFIKAWKYLDHFDAEKSFKTWIFSISKNTCLDFLKKKKNLTFSDLETFDEKHSIIENIADSSPLPNEIFEQRDIAKHLSESLQKLSPANRMLLFLRYNDHFTFREIAESLNEPLHTIKSRHRHALILLKDLLGRISK